MMRRLVHRQHAHHFPSPRIFPSQHPSHNSLTPQNRRLMNSNSQRYQTDRKPTNAGGLDWAASGKKEKSSNESEMDRIGPKAQRDIVAISKNKNIVGKIKSKNPPFLPLSGHTKKSATQNTHKHKITSTHEVRTT